MWSALQWAAAVLCLCGPLCPTDAATQRIPGQTGPQRSSIERLERQLYSNDKAEREAAARALSLYPRQAAPVLRTALHSYDLDVVKAAVHSTWALGPNAGELVGDLLYVLHHGGHGMEYGSCEFPDLTLRWEVEIALELIGPRVLHQIERSLRAELQNEYIENGFVVSLAHVFEQLSNRAKFAVPTLQAAMAHPEISESAMTALQDALAAIGEE